MYKQDDEAFQNSDFILCNRDFPLLVALWPMLNSKFFCVMLSLLGRIVVSSHTHDNNYRAVQ